MGRFLRLFTDIPLAEIHRLEANNTNSVKSATDNIRFVLETKEGWFARHNIGEGTVIRTEKGPSPHGIVRACCCALISED